MKKLITILACVFSSLLWAVSLNKIVVFGDSLSDTGNLYEYMKHQLPVSPPYYQGRFTNGPVWVEILSNLYYAKEPNLHLLDYAFGGAGVLDNEDSDDELFTLHKEVNSYFLSTHNKADEKALYVIWIGANNYLALPEDPDRALSQVISGIDNEINKFIANGAKHILLINVPNLGEIPAARDFDAEELLTNLAYAHNEVLLQKFNEYKTSHPEIQWIYYDIFHDMEQMMSYPAHFGFTNVKETCYEQIKVASKHKRSVLGVVSNLKFSGKANPCEGYLFFDPVHPSAKAHALIAERIKALLEGVGIEFR